MLKKHHWILVAILLVTISLVACGNETSANQEDLRSYFPMGPGMTYKFKGIGNEFAAFRRETKFKKEPYVQIHDSSGTTVAKVYKVKKDKITQIMDKPGFYDNTNLLSNLEDNSQTEEVILQAPLEVGNSWKSGETKREIVKVAQTITVPAGTFHDVVQVKATSTKEDRKFGNYKYYAKNVGLIMSKSVGENYEVVSKLKSYNRSTPEKDKQEAALEDPELALLAYQLNHQAQSSFQAAYESWINFDKLTEQKQRSLEQIITILRNELADIAVQSEIDEYVERLKEYYKAGEGELTFPTHEVVKEVKITDKTKNHARIDIKVMRYYPKREWSGKAHNEPVKYQIDLLRRNGKWKVKSRVK